jgi:hypothetical protein
LDTEEEIWSDYFTKQELDEIRDHKSFELTPLPAIGLRKLLSMVYIYIILAFLILLATTAKGSS